MTAGQVLNGCNQATSLSPELERRHAGCPVKLPSEVCLIGERRLGCHLRERERTLPKQPHCVGNPAPPHVAAQGAAEVVPEAPYEMHAVNAGVARECIGGRRVAPAIGQVIARGQEPRRRRAGGATGFPPAQLRQQFEREVVCRGVGAAWLERRLEAPDEGGQSGIGDERATARSSAKGGGVLAAEFDQQAAGAVGAEVNVVRR